MHIVRDVTQILAYLATLSLLTPLLATYMEKVFRGEKTVLSPILGRFEQLIYRLAGVDPEAEMGWKQYLSSLSLFSGAGILVLFLLQILQDRLPWNPQNLPPVSWDLALNTAVSFVTNTNWQSYAGETTLSFMTQMAGLTVQNFVSAATGIAVMLALVRGIERTHGATIGNFWNDLIRTTLYILLPLAVVFSFLLAHEGVVQTFQSPAVVATLEGGRQVIPLGPAASQVAIKQLGTNGGGFFNANSAHPLENPTPLSDFLELLAILLIPSALVIAFGRLVGSPRQGWVLWGSMMALLIIALVISLTAE
jgi:K+-transporting ATPase ATPase A chain